MRKTKNKNHYKKYNLWYVFIAITENTYHFVECVRKVKIKNIMTLGGFLMGKSYEDFLWRFSTVLCQPSPASVVVCSNSALSNDLGVAFSLGLYVPSHFWISGTIFWVLLLCCIVKLQWIVHRDCQKNQTFKKAFNENYSQILLQLFLG